jgi:hypothetical protein
VRDVLTELKPEDVFKIHPRITWATYARSYGEVVFSQTRLGVETQTSDETNRSILQNALEFWRSGLFERFVPGESTGRVESITINFEKFSVLWMNVKDGTLTISLDMTDVHNVYNVFQEIDQSIKKLSYT